MDKSRTRIVLSLLNDFAEYGIILSRPVSELDVFDISQYTNAT